MGANASLADPSSLQLRHALTNLCICALRFTVNAGRQVEPEVYPRSDGSVYVCGEPQSIPVPTTPMDVTVEASLCDNVREVAASLSSQLAQVR